MPFLRGTPTRSNTLHLSKQYNTTPDGSSLGIIRDSIEIQQCTVPQMREALGCETLECRRHLAAATTFYQSINNLIYLLAQVQNTPISSDTSPPTPMPTSTPSSPVQSLYGTISAYYSHPSLLTVLKPFKYMPCLSLEPSATLIDPWNLLFNITFIFVFSSIFWIIICAYISQL